MVRKAVFFIPILVLCLCLASARPASAVKKCDDPQLLARMLRQLSESQTRTDVDFVPPFGKKARDSTAKMEHTLDVTRGLEGIRKSTSLTIHERNPEAPDYVFTCQASLVEDNKNYYVSFVVETETPGKEHKVRARYLRAGKFFQYAIKYFQTAYPIAGVQAVWEFGSNLDKVNELTSPDSTQPLRIEEAIPSTWTAGQAQIAGFGAIQKGSIVTKGKPGKYTMVRVVFEKAPSASGP